MENRDDKIVERINFGISNYIKKNLEKDTENFRISKKNLLINKIIYWFLEENEEENGKNKIEKEIYINVSLNKNKLGKDIQEIFGNYSNNENNSEKLFDLVNQYMLLPKYKREKILYNDNFEKISEAISKNKKVRINYERETDKIEKESLKIEPYNIFTTKEEEHNYIYAWCDEYNKFWKFRLSNIASIFNCTEKAVHKLDYTVNKGKEDFSTAFIGEKIKIKVLIKDKYLYKRITFNKPEEITNDGDIYWFECPFDMAVAYFSQFLEKCEIIEPIELREKMKEKIKEAYENYNKI